MAHPRVGGENENAPRLVDVSQGSSPRGRGKHFRFSIRRRSKRLIPAWAGKTVHAVAPHGGMGAHPRVGGENVNARRGLAWRNGSSPRGRGKRD